jgi:hypothetical protein
MPQAGIRKMTLHRGNRDESLDRHRNSADYAQDALSGMRDWGIFDDATIDAPISRYRTTRVVPGMMSAGEDITEDFRADLALEPFNFALAGPQNPLSLTHGPGVALNEGIDIGPKLTKVIKAQGTAHLVRVIHGLHTRVQETEFSRAIALLEYVLMPSYPEAYFQHAPMHAPDPLGRENIVGIGVGEKVIGSERTGLTCIKVFVVRKVSPDRVQWKALVPRQVHGIPTDVVETGPFSAASHQGSRNTKDASQPIAMGGDSVRHPSSLAGDGTLGCLVERGGVSYILSNNHILANSNAARIGDAILCPGGHAEGVAPDNMIARLSSYVRLKFGGLFGFRANYADVAIARSSAGFVSPHNRCFGRLMAAPPNWVVGDHVKKCGRTTLATHGEIEAFTARINIAFPAAHGWHIAEFRKQIIIRSSSERLFARSGDSGALILSEENVPIALLFAVNEAAGFAIATPIETALLPFGVAVAT